MLNQKEKDVLILLAQGKSNKEIAIVLQYSLDTIKKRVSKLFKLYKVKNRVELANEYNAEQMAKI